MISPKKGQKDATLSAVEQTFDFQIRESTKLVLFIKNTGSNSITAGRVLKKSERHSKDAGLSFVPIIANETRVLELESQAFHEITLGLTSSLGTTVQVDWRVG